MREVTRKQVTVGTAELSMLVAGPSDGEPVLLLHGIPAGASLWRAGMPYLVKAGFCIYAPDLPGYGRTRLPANGDYSLNGAAELLARWLTESDIGPVWVVGHDLGGGVAQIMAVKYPEVVRLLTLSNAPAEDSWPVGAVVLSRFLARVGLFGPLAASGYISVDPYIGRELRRAVIDKEILHRNHPQRSIFFDTKFNTASGRRAFSAHLRALDNGQTEAVAPLLRQIQVPVLLLWGKMDPFQPWNTTGRRLQTLLPDPDVHLLENASHFCMLDQPDEFFATLLGWRARQA